MRVARIVKYYRRLPEPRPGDEADVWSAGFQRMLTRFRRQVKVHYNEGTLQRLLHSQDVQARRAAVVALGLLGTIESNAQLAACLQDEDELVRQFASNSLWSLWFRGGSEEENRELEQLAAQDDLRRALAGLTELSQRTPEFAEVYNQRAIVWFKLGEFRRSIEDCERVLALNPYHFGAQAGMAQCYMRLNKPRAALRAFRNALRINPNLSDVARTIRNLEDALGGGIDER